MDNSINIAHFCKDWIASQNVAVVRPLSPESKEALQNEETCVYSVPDFYFDKSKVKDICEDNKESEGKESKKNKDHHSKKNHKKDRKKEGHSKKSRKEKKDKKESEHKKHKKSKESK